MPDKEAVKSPFRFCLSVPNWLRRNWKRVITGFLFAVVTIFGSIGGLIQFVQDSLRVHFISQSLNVFQLALLGVGVAGLVFLAWDATRGPSRKTGTDPRYTRSDEFDAWTNKDRFKLGETVFFEVRFKGRLRHGFYFAHIVRPDGRSISGWDIQTLPRPRVETKGELHGETNHKWHEWAWIIPLDFPTGKYTPFVRVHDHYPLDWMTAVKAWACAISRRKTGV